MPVIQIQMITVNCDPYVRNVYFTSVADPYHSGYHMITIVGSTSMTHAQSSTCPRLCGVSMLGHPLRGIASLFHIILNA